MAPNRKQAARRAKAKRKAKTSVAAEVAAPLDYQSVLSKARLVPEPNTEDFWTATCLFGHGLEYSSGSGLCGERFWTIVQEVEGDVLRAEVNNHLLAPDSPRPKVRGNYRVPAAPHHRRRLCPSQRRMRGASHSASGGLRS